ncbi:hypothetical protein B4083_4530 [Bacillus cereus]|nr:hypothetical protein B4083_4530 [Bacillus cereus]
MMKKIFSIFTSFSFGCNKSLLNKIGKEKYYVLIKDEGVVEDQQRIYDLPAYNKDRNDGKLKGHAFLCLYVNEDIKKFIDVKTYEEVKKENLVVKVKGKRIITKYSTKKNSNILSA